MKEEFMQSLVALVSAVSKGIKNRQTNKRTNILLYILDIEKTDY
jgi:hypothetical protein